MKKLVVFLLTFIALKVSYGQSSEIAPSYIKAPIVTVLPTYTLPADKGKIVYLQQIGDTEPFTETGDLYLWDGVTWKSLARFNQEPISISTSERHTIADFRSFYEGENSATMVLVNAGVGNSNAIEAIATNNNPTSETTAVLGYNDSNNGFGVGIKGVSFGGSGVRGESSNGLGVVGIGGQIGVSAFSPTGIALQASINNTDGFVAFFTQNNALNAQNAFTIYNNGTGYAASFNGNKALTTVGQLRFEGIGAAVGSVLTSYDTQGNATWQDNIPKGFVKQLAGSEPIGTNGNGFKTITFNFPSAFATPPKVMATVAAQSGTNYPDTWVATVRSVTTTTVIFNIQRVDNPTAQWTQSPMLNWFAWE
jgi:hypothetical protein